MKLTEQWLSRAAHPGQNSGVMVVGVAVGIAHNILNSLPLGLIAGGTIQATHTGLISNTVVIGVYLGPNLMVTGLLATTLWLLALLKDADGRSFM